ncbi:MAG: hypothetical protein PHO37_13450 [Kiritimatiellae bacterium]|nr:hypothetical protein [Kiritimatiellia bacterium]
MQLMLLILPLTLAADIFFRTPRRAANTLRNLGGGMVYESAVEINGRAGSLTTFAFDETSEAIAQRLARQLKLPPPGAGSTMIADTSGKTLCRYFILPAPVLGNACLVTAIEQRAGVFRSSTGLPPPWPDGIPVFNATAEFTAACDKTRCTFLSASSLCGSPEQAVEEAANTLTQAGWEATVPGTPTFMIFTKKNQQCVVFSTENPRSGQITINLLQREGSKQ